VSSKVPNSTIERAPRAVLIVGAKLRIAVTIARSLSRRGISVDVAAFPDDGWFSSRAIREFIRIPNPNESVQDFMQSLCDLINRKGYDMLFPCGDHILSAISEHYERLKGLLYVACPDPNITGRVLDKWETLAVAAKCGIPVPKTYIIRGLSDLDAIGNGVAFPVVVKPRRKLQNNEFKVYYAENSEELFAQLNSIGTKSGEVLVQEYLSGEGMGVEVLMHEGSPVAIFQHRRIKEVPSQGGAGVLVVSEHPDAKLVLYSIDLLRGLDWNGVAMVEFRINRTTGHVALMEINGRYWGSLFLPFRVGIDFPFYEWQLAHGLQPTVPESYLVGIRVRWTAGTIRRFHGVFTKSGPSFQACSPRWKELMGFVRDLLPTTRDALWSIKDPMPYLQELGRIVPELFVPNVRGIIKSLLPEKVLNHYRIFRRLGTPAGQVYLKLRLLRRFGRKKRRIEKLLRTAHSILFVCHGNIIRSPMAKALLVQKLKQNGTKHVRIVSAGLHASSCRKADPRAQTVAREFGICLDDHRSQRVTAKMIEEADVIFVMDFVNEAELVAEYPQAAKKTCLMGGLFEGEEVELSDPYDRDTAKLRSCFSRLDKCTKNLASVVNRGPR
jgi:predicted ATP-grasp superfamily ATP-dependent carboligase/protein-tyrosine-phosphatase